MNKFLFSADYGMGIGDFLIKLYAIAHLNRHVKHTINNASTTFIVEEYSSNILHKILNLEFFHNAFDLFAIQNRHDQYISNLGFNYISYNNEDYHRVYSAINDYNNNKKGYWEAYLSNSSSGVLTSVDYANFDYRDPTTRKSEPIPDYNLSILNSKFFIQAEDYITNKNIKSFECVYYKSLDSLDKQHLNAFISQLKTNISKQTNLFVTSNSEIAKEIIIAKISNVKSYKPINTSQSDGYGTANSDQDRIDDLITEMIIMSYANKIHYCGNYHYISLFNYYAHMVKQIPLINYLIEKI